MMAETLGEVARRVSHDPRVADREQVRTPMGEVCMSHAEAQEYRDALELRKLLAGEAGHDLHDLPLDGDGSPRRAIRS